MRYSLYGFAAFIIWIAAFIYILTNITVPTFAADQQHVKFKPLDQVPINSGDWNSLSQERRKQITDHVKKAGLLSKTGGFVPNSKSPTIKDLSVPVKPVNDTFLCYACRSAKAAVEKSCEASGGSPETIAYCKSSAWAAGYECCYK